MQLTEVRVNLCSGQAGRLKAFCSLTFDDTFVAELREKAGECRFALKRQGKVSRYTDVPSSLSF